MKIGLIGLGRMGGAIGQRLDEQGFESSPGIRGEGDAAGGGTRGENRGNPKVIAAEAEMVISIITEDHGVWKVFTGPDGLLEADVQGKLFIEMSTLQPTTGRELAPLVEAKGARLIESPVLGTIPSVHEGKLFSLAGGRAEDIDRARVVLDRLTRRVAHMGPHGSGYAMKLAVNLGLGAYIQALSESLALGTKQELALDQMLDVLKEAPTATGWLHSRSRPARRAGRRDARYPHDEEGYHVGRRDRRALRRTDAAVGRHIGVVVCSGCGRGWRRRSCGSRQVCA